jgi:hypothetical protein
MNFDGDRYGHLLVNEPELLLHLSSGIALGLS